jgi:hypothetical protein
MKALMIDVVRCYDFLIELSAAKGTLISLHRHLFTHGAKVIDLK